MSGTLRPSTALAAALAALALAVPAAAEAKEATVVAADVSLELAEDASLLVNERLTVDYDGDFQATYREIRLNFGEQIRNVAVSEPDGGAYEPGGCAALGCFDSLNRFGTEPAGNGLRIVWHHGAADETRTFDVSYRVVDAAVAYDDVIDVVWQVWGDEWEQKLPELKATFSDPALDPADERYRVWAFPREVQSGEITRDDGVSTLTATDIPPKQFVEMRVLVPRVPGEDVSGARAGEGSALASIVEEETSKDLGTFSWTRIKRFISQHTFLLSLAVALLALAFIALLAFRARERPTTSPKYLPGPPDEETSPALAYAIAFEGADSVNTVLATLLDLVDRDYYTTKTATTEAEQLDLSIAKNPERPSEDGLATHERSVLSFYDELIGEKTVALSAMKDLVPRHDTAWRSRWDGMTTAIYSVEGEQIEWGRDYSGWETRAILVFGALFALIGFASSDAGGSLLWPLVLGIPTCLFLLAYPSNSLKRLSPESRERNARWKAFADWTADFPKLEDDPPATLALWKRIIVFGIAFGTAERMIASGRIPAPVAAEATSTGAWTTYAFVGGYHHDSFNGSSFGSDFSSHVTPPASSSSGGGGGFSGGGGGGSGGGGGGSW
ncbi:MAG: DUF2207 family protein [Solirubrobacterales bacterium]